MENKMKTSCTAERVLLKDVLPIEVPYKVQFNLSDACNLKCEYCGLHKNEISSSFMSFELFEKAVQQLKCFKDKIRVIWLVGMGEPLLHKDIIEMIHLLKTENISRDIGIVTNGIRLTKDMSDKLIAAGLTILRVSVNGLSNEDYKKYTNTTIDFNQYCKNIQYFYNNARGTKIYIKILNYMVKDIHRREYFYQIFKDISHNCTIENLQTLDKDIDYERIAGTKKLNNCLYENVQIESQICAQPFYSMYINTLGQITPCCTANKVLKMGDLNTEELTQIWNGYFFNKFRIRMLQGAFSANNICRECKTYLHTMTEEDILDEKAELLKKQYERRLNL
ncbi:MAG: radical SAM/SPASM domain-containing protein [Clostridiales bacterium]|jgi:MoaA/NifB/PqqE/SkfB family radical SAM enzyme|nr:radical SAM/SPASM domain-containing protein [Clostridiales bacterium]